jgi:hypothetical protein
MLIWIYVTSRETPISVNARPPTPRLPNFGPRFSTTTALFLKISSWNSYFIRSIYWISAQPSFLLLGAAQHKSVKVVSDIWGATSGKRPPPQPPPFYREPL